MIEVAALAVGACGFIFGLAGLLRSNATARQVADHLAAHEARATLQQRQSLTDEHRIHTNGHHR